MQVVLSGIEVAFRINQVSQGTVVGGHRLPGLPIKSQIKGLPRFDHGPVEVISQQVNLVSKIYCH